MVSRMDAATSSAACSSKAASRLGSTAGTVSAEAMGPSMKPFSVHPEWMDVTRQPVSSCRGAHALGERQVIGS